jgi:hypothetical protein
MNTVRPSRFLKGWSFPKNPAKHVHSKLWDLSGGLNSMLKLVYERKCLLNPKNSIPLYSWGMSLFIGWMMRTLTSRVSCSLPRSTAKVWLRLGLSYLPISRFFPYQPLSEILINKSKISFNLEFSRTGRDPRRSKLWILSQCRILIRIFRNAVDTWVLETYLSWPLADLINNWVLRTYLFQVLAD